ncbi:hypothetical protein J6590_009550 [Homalodisca vitripennis]|nr:hypothetical protein J6590_009550 [Homalodisca vitripennis]
MGHNHLVLDCKYCSPLSGSTDSTSDLYRFPEEFIIKELEGMLGMKTARIGFRTSLQGRE